MLLRIFGLVFLGLVLGGGSLKAAVGAEALTLAAAQRIALQRNTDLLSARAQLEVAIAQLRTAREFPNPSLSLSTSHINTDGTGNGTPAGNRFLDRSYDSITALSQLLEICKRGPRRAAAQAAQTAAQAQRDDVRRLLIKAVSQAYVAALEAEEESATLAESAASLRHEAALTATRFAAGDIAATDQAQIEIIATQRELAAAAARQAATIALIALETILGDPAPDGHTRLADSLATLGGPAAGLPADAVAGARPDITAAEALVAKAEADLVAQGRVVIPDVTISAQYERNPPAAPNSAGVGLTFPLPLWNRNGGAIRGARAARELALAQLDKTRTAALAEIASARSAYRTAIAQADAYAHELTAKSTGVVKTVAFSYEHGGAALVELLAAERNANDIRLSAVRAQAEAASAAFALTSALNLIEPAPEATSQP